MSEWFYRRLLGLYPAVYLRDYREPMEQAFRDQLRDTASVSRRIGLSLAAMNDVTRGAVTMHLELETGALSIGALFLAMSVLICGTAWAVKDNRWVSLVMNLCALVLGYLDPVREMTFGSLKVISRRWCFRLFLVTSVAGLVLGNWQGHFHQPDLLAMGLITSRLGAYLRRWRSPEFHDLEFVNVSGPVIFDLGLRDRASLDKAP
jgi:hypothetical protein